MKLVTTSQTFSLIRLGTNFAYDFFQKQSPDVFYKKTVLKKFHNVQRLTPALESIFNELERFARCSLVFARGLLRFRCCSLVFARGSLVFARCLLLFTRCSRKILRDFFE